MYDDPEHPNRPTSSIPSPAYTDEDRALLMALEEHDASLCACGEPKTTAWHGDMDGWYAHEGYVCHACTARAGRQVVYGRIIDTRPADRRDLPRFQLGVTTTPPEEQSGKPGPPTRPADVAMA